MVSMNKARLYSGSLAFPMPLLPKVAEVLVLSVLEDPAGEP
jgi:hypothetical protein